MPLGGGFFTAQDKILPGAYINFVSVQSATSMLAPRGTVALPLTLNWGPVGEVITVEASGYNRRAESLLGYAPSAPELLPVREALRHSSKLYLFRLGQDGVKASNDLAEAKYPGTLGNALVVKVEVNTPAPEPDPPGEGDGEGGTWDVTTLLNGQAVDVQRNVGSVGELKPNAWLSWKSGATLTETAGMPLAGGTNGEPTAAEYQSFLDAMERYTFHAMGCPSTDAEVVEKFVSYTKRQRDEVGKKFQTVVFRTLADYEGIVSLKNGLASDPSSPALIPWAAGVLAGTAVESSASNLTYDGELAPDVNYTQAQLEEAMLEGSWVMHQMDDTVAVLADLNTFTTFSEEKSKDFQQNQVIRVLDQIANDVAYIFGHHYYGKVPNDQAGRASLWNDIVKHHLELQTLRAIEGFESEEVKVEAGEDPRAVIVQDRVKPVNALHYLYMTVLVG